MWEILDDIPLIPRVISRSNSNNLAQTITLLRGAITFQNFRNLYLRCGIPSFCASLYILPEEFPGAGSELVVEEAVDDDVERAVGHQQEAVHRRHHLQRKTNMLHYFGAQAMNLSRKMMNDSGTLKLFSSSHLQLMKKKGTSRLSQVWGIKMTAEELLQELILLDPWGSDLLYRATASSTKLYEKLMKSCVHA